MSRRAWSATIACLLWLTPHAAEACSCVGASPCQALSNRRDSPLNVFEATVESIEHRPMRHSGANGEVLVSAGTMVVRLKDVRPLLGEGATTIETSGDGASCGYSFSVGRRYVIDAYGQNGRISTGLCSQTKPIEQASALLAYVESLGRPSSGATVSGVARVSSLGSRFSPRPRPEGLGGLTIALDGPVSRSAVTSADGRFSFASLPAGLYRLNATPGRDQQFLEPPRAIAFDLPHAHACYDAFVSIALAASIEGTVLDPDGRPVSNASIALRPEDALRAPPVEGFSHFIGYATTRSDQFGRYVFNSVPPGRYVVGLNLDSGPTYGSPYVAVAVTRPDGQPEVIDFPLGGHLVLPAMVAVVPSKVTVTGRVTWPDGRPGNTMKVRATAHGETSRGVGAIVEATVDLDGRFALVVPEGVLHTFSAFVHHDKVTRDDDYEFSARMDAVAGAGEITLVLSRRR